MVFYSSHDFTQTFTFPALSTLLPNAIDIRTLIFRISWNVDIVFVFISPRSEWTFG